MRTKEITNLRNEPDVVEVSFVIPVFNEVESLDELYQSLKTIVTQHTWKAEIIFIDDGSNDGSLRKLVGIRNGDRRVKVISFRKNLGKSAALNQGFKAARGTYIVTMDSDLQDKVENVPLMLKKLEEGSDMIVGWKKDRHDPIEKRVWSKIFNFWMQKTTGVRIHDFNCGLKIMKHEVVENIELYGELHRFLPLMAAQQGFRIDEMAVAHAARKFGHSKYGLGRTIAGALDYTTVSFLSNFSDRPLHLFGLLGLATIAVGTVLGGYLSVLHFEGYKIGDRPLLILAVLLIISGVQLVSTGLIAELLIRGQKLRR